MKQLFSIFLTFLLSTFLLAQDQAPAVELFFITEGAPTYPIIACTLTAKSQCWAISLPVPPEPGGYYLSDDYDNSIYVPRENNMGQLSAGFDFVTSMGGAPGTGYPDFAYGLYKLTINGSNKYFYLDYRDYRVGYYELFNPPTYGEDIDIWIRYNYSIDKFYYTSHLGQIAFTEISNGQLLNIWDIKQKGAPQTSLFPDYWGKCLALINDGYNHPKLVWGPHPSFTTTHFYIYRAVGTIPIDPKNITFLLYAVFNASTYELTSYDFVIEVDPTHYAFYYVKAFNSSNSTFSSATNGVSTEGQYVPYKISNDQLNENKSVGFRLEQNYPNPFNPTTMISFSIGKDDLVTLKVFDILGNEITTLVNEYKSLGNYQIAFNAEEIPSGIYFYTLTAGNFASTKKLILLK